MTRKEMILAASERLGRRILSGTVAYAIHGGHVPQPERRADGWYHYEQKHVDALAAYCKARPGRKGRPRKAVAEVSA